MSRYFEDVTKQYLGKKSNFEVGTLPQVRPLLPNSIPEQFIWNLWEIKLHWGRHFYSERKIAPYLAHKYRPGGMPLLVNQHVTSLPS
jgi:hypothetical protein